MNENDVHIEWNGPMSLEDVEKLTGADDVGIYQIYWAALCLWCVRAVVYRQD